MNLYYRMAVIILLCCTPMHAFSQISIEANTEDASCYGQADGAITLSVTGGETPYTYNWSNGTSNQNLTNLKKGYYNVTVSGSGGNQATAFYAIDEPTPITIETYVDRSMLCYGESTFAIATAEGGTGAISYLWDDPRQQQTAKATGLPAGSYQVSAIDEDGCEATSSITVSEFAPLEIKTETTEDVSCTGGENGLISIGISGGKKPYQTVWSNNQTNVNSITSLTAGNYSTTVTDDIGCQATKEYTIAEPDNYFGINITDIQLEDITCQGYSDGSIQLTLEDQEKSFSLQWNSNDGGGLIENETAITGLEAGTYQITVTDESGCAISTSYTLQEPAGITIDSTTITLPPEDSDYGKIKIYASGGSSLNNLLYSIDKGENYYANNGLFDSVPEGRYTVMVKDINGCAKEGNVINVLKATTDINKTPASTPNFKIYPNPSDGNFTVQLKNKLKKDFTIKVFNAVGEQVYQQFYPTQADHVWAEVNLNHVNAGLYLVTVTNDQTKYSKQIIIR